MNLRQLRYFIALTEYKNFSVAANHLFISQPTLSQEIAKLEGEFGFPLFVRLPRAIQLTEEAKALLPRAQSILDDAADLMRYAEVLKKRQQGVAALVVGLDTGWNQFECRGITDQFYHFRETHPEIAMSLMPFQYPDGLPQLENGSMDLAIIFGSQSLLNGLSCNYKILAEEEICLAVPAALAGEEPDIAAILARHNLLIIANDADHMVHANAVLKRYNCQPKIVGCRDSSSILAYIGAGAGVGLVSNSYSMGQNLKNVRILRLAPDPPMGYLAVIWSKKSRNPAAKKLIESLCGGAVKLEVQSVL